MLQMFSCSSIPGDVQDDGITVGSLLYFLFLLFVCLFGTIGNAMTIIAVRVEAKLREAVSRSLILVSAFNLRISLNLETW